MTTRRPISVGQMLTEEFLQPLNIEIKQLAEAMQVHRNSLSRLINGKTTLTAPMAIKLAAALGTTPEFWLNLQHAVELWDIRNQTYANAAKDIKPIIGMAVI